MNIRNRTNGYMAHLPMSRLSKAELAAIAVSFGARLSGNADNLSEGGREVLRELWALHDAGIIERPRAPRITVEEEAQA